jgi:hypothetical protein
VLAEPLAELEPVEAGKHHVEDDCVIGIFGGHPEAVGSGACDVDGMALLLEPALEKACHPGLVLNNQHSHVTRLCGTTGNYLRFPTPRVDRGVDYQEFRGRTTRLHPVEALTTDGLDEALSEGVGPTVPLIGAVSLARQTPARAGLWVEVEGREDFTLHTDSNDGVPV